MNKSMSEEQRLMNWYYACTELDCGGSATVIKNIDLAGRRIELSFRDGSVTLSFEDALKHLKEATPETKRGSEW